MTSSKCAPTQDDIVTILPRLATKPISLGTCFRETNALAGIRDHEVRHNGLLFGFGIDHGADGGKPIQMFVHVESADQIYRKALAAGGQAVMEPYDEGDSRMAGIADPCGNLWWLKSSK